jgi:O-acetyl-ADP-ribose deacetylase (regulator of RNase III)
LGDICNETTDAITNAANSQLNHGAGVAGAISEKGGPSIQKDSNNYIKQHGPLNVSDAILLSAGYLPSKYVIHAMVPIYKFDDVQQSEKLLINTIVNIIKICNQHKLSSVSIPAISSGIFLFPVSRCAELIINTIIATVDSNSTLDRINLINIDEPTAAHFARYLNSLNVPPAALPDVD